MPLPAYLQHFTDRQDQIAAFDALWPGDGRWILAFSGLSGNGKSTLIKYLIETRCKGSAIRDAQARAQAGSDPQAWRDVLYHRCFNNPADQFDAWRKAIDQANFAFDHLWWNELLEVMELPAIYRQLSEQQQADVRLRRGRWHYYHNKWDAALASYRQALNLFRTVGDRLGQANALKAQGDVLALIAGTKRWPGTRRRWPCSNTWATA